MNIKIKNLVVLALITIMTIVSAQETLALTLQQMNTTLDNSLINKAIIISVPPSNLVFNDTVYTVNQASLNLQGSFDWTTGGKYTKAQMYIYKKTTLDFPSCILYNEIITPISGTNKFSLTSDKLNFSGCNDIYYGVYNIEITPMTSSTDYDAAKKIYKTFTISLPVALDPNSKTLPSSSANSTNKIDTIDLDNLSTSNSNLVKNIDFSKANTTIATSAATASNSPDITGLTVSPVSYDPSKGSLNITYSLAKGGKITNTEMQVANISTNKNYYNLYSSAPKEGANTYSWNGVASSDGKVIPDGNYYLNIIAKDSNGNVIKSVNTQFTVKVVVVSTTTNTSGSNSSNSASTSSSNNASSSSGATGSTGTSDGSTTVALKDSPDILTCKAEAKKLYYENGEPAYDRLGVNCALNTPALVRAIIYNKSYNPKAADNAANVVRIISLDTQKQPGKLLYFGWDGYDDYDQAAPLEEYNFVVEARLNATYKPDISVQKFRIDNAPVDTKTTNVEAAKTTEAKATSTSVGVSGETLHGAADSATSTPVKTTETKSESSKCPGVNYPNDIAGNSAEAEIRAAYDKCLIQGYTDGSFRPEGTLTRAEAVKISVLAIGETAHQGCYTADCGSPFKDLDTWQGPWVRAAWDQKYVSGISEKAFAPNRSLTRAEAVALLVKAKKIKPFVGCYTANCGAGFPNNFFRDIRQNWQGPYLRALWDLKVIDTVEPFKFYPDKAITRADFVKMIMALEKYKAVVTSGNGG